MSTMRQYEQIMLPRTSSCNSTTMIIPPNSTSSTTTSFPSPVQNQEDFRRRRSIIRRGSTSATTFHRLSTSFLRSILSIFTFPSVLPACRWLSIPAGQLSINTGRSLGRKVTGTLFGHRRGHVSFAIQDNPRSEPVFLIEFAVSTSALVKEMSSGMVRIALESEKALPPRAAAAGRLFGEVIWTMYCNGRKCGYAPARACTESDWHVLRTVRSVSVGAGVIPVVDDGGKDGGGGAAVGELLYMRARFERVVGNRDSEAFYMLNPDGNGGPELSIFLLRI